MQGFFNVSGMQRFAAKLRNMCITPTHAAKTASRTPMHHTAGVLYLSGNWLLSYGSCMDCCMEGLRFLLP
jgi:hypothetical protein